MFGLHTEEKIHQRRIQNKPYEIRKISQYNGLRSIDLSSDESGQGDALSPDLFHETMESYFEPLGL